MYSWLNVGSLLLGLTALVIPVIIIVRYKKTGNRNQPVLYGASMCACALSLFFQICYRFKGTASGTITVSTF